MKSLLALKVRLPMRLHITALRLVQYVIGKEPAGEYAERAPLDVAPDHASATGHPIKERTSFPDPTSLSPTSLPRHKTRDIEDMQAPQPLAAYSKGEKVTVPKRGEESPPPFLANILVS